MTTTGGYVSPDKRRYQVYSHAAYGNPLYIGSFDNPVDASELVRRMLEAMRPLGLTTAQQHFEIVDA